MRNYPKFRQICEISLVNDGQIFKPSCFWRYFLIIKWMYNYKWWYLIFVLLCDHHTYLPSVLLTPVEIHIFISAHVGIDFGDKFYL